MSDVKTMVFDVDSTEIDIKPILKKEFLELRMKAVSSANPNRNNSWFTEEALAKGAATFKNKPILGYFEKGDFVSHNGEWNYDPETQMDYWDTLSGKGERILGFIRSEDDVEIVKDENGLSWICLSCALWVQYNFKQVKRLLKDAKKAKEKGGSAKNISVEVNITDYETLPNGVMKIKDFELVGITILGSRNGVKVEPGIEGAELSVVDIMGTQYFEQQQKALRLAYEKLEAPEENNIKEENANMSVNNEKVAEDLTQNTEATYAQEEVCPVCNQEPCVCAANEDKPEEKSEKEECGKEEKEECGKQEKEESKPEECSNDDDDDDDDEEEDEENQEYAAEETETQTVAEKTVAETTPVRQEESSESNMIQNDLVWLLKELTYPTSCFESCMNYYNTYYDGSYKDYIVSLLNRLYKSNQESIIEISDAVKKMAEDSLSELDQEEEKNLSVYSFKELYKEYSSLKEKEASEASLIKEYQKKDFLREADEILQSIDSLSEDQRKEFRAQCENDSIISLEDLKVKVALTATFVNVSSKAAEQADSENIEKTDVYSAPVVTPSTDVLGGKAEKTTKESSIWDKIHEYISKD